MRDSSGSSSAQYTLPTKRRASGRSRSFSTSARLNRPPVREEAARRSDPKDMTAFSGFGGGRQVVDHATEIFHAGGHADFGRDFRGAEFHVLLDNGPTGIAILQERPEESREIDAALADDREDLVFDGFLEGPLVVPRLLEDFSIAVLDVNETKFALVFLRFRHGIAVAVDAVAGVEAKADVRVRSAIEEALAFFGRLNIGGDVRMEYEVQPEFVGHFFRLLDNLAHVLPLVRA